MRQTPIPVIVTSKYRAVVFGHTTDASARPISLTDARMCLIWSKDVGGVFGMAEIGPTKGCRISAVAPRVTLEDVTAVFDMTEAAVDAWLNAPVHGRDHD